MIKNAALCDEREEIFFFPLSGVFLIKHAAVLSNGLVLAYKINEQAGRIIIGIFLRERKFRLFSV